VGFNSLTRSNPFRSVFVKFQAKYAVALASATLLMAPIFCSTTVLAAQIQASVARTDNGLAAAADVKDVVVALKVPNRPALEAFVASTVDPKSANFRKFLTPAEFKARFGQSDAVVARVSALLKANGLSVTKVHENNLLITARGTNAQLAKLFATEIHSYTEKGETFDHPVSKAVIPAALADVVAHVAGLSTKPIYHANLHTVPKPAKPVALALADAVRPANAMPAPGVPQQYTVGDLAKQYNVTPLYTRGMTGAGTTLGIMTFATFKTTDVAAYWAGVGISNSTTRITTINASAPTKISSNGADETTLDVEQSGGLAPGAKIIVYEGANTDAGELQLYSAAVNANVADTLSISWGEPEVAEDNIDSLDVLFLQSASQGVPITAASADSGSYDLNNSQVYPYPDYSATLSVDFPASSPYVLGAGGTTLPVTLKLTHGTIVVPAVRPWAWDYLSNYIIANDGQAYYYANIFPVGGGGGVSVNYPLPSYQTGLPGVQVSAAGQSLFCFTNPPAGSAQPCTPGEDLIDLPAAFVGRNVPDISLDADPESGYSLYFGGSWSTGSGGTSFVAPQLNGIFALITQQAGHRLGWLHPQLYGAFKTQGYAAGSPFRPVTTGTNWFYSAKASYNPATGIGEIDADNLATLLSK
jgi:subtilase family serine protease